MKLYIDSTDNLRTIVEIGDHQLVKTYAKAQDQDVLGAIDEIFRQTKLKPADLTEIEVNPGPGSFTGTRVGVAIANALAFALKIQVNGQSRPVTPVYARPPNITHTS